MPPTYFPLRWESTGEQWWYASPLDWAAANGHYDLVRELLRIDSNHLIKLTSLRRIRRLETVWDDEEQFNDVAKCRCQVAWKLFHECESRGSKNSLVRAGYGGWLMYTAASAGDLGFVQVLLEKHPLLVFGEGEYGVTDIIYAAARSKNSKVFKLIFDFAVSPRLQNGKDGILEEQIGDIPSVYKWEMTNRAVHAAARGGNVKILNELVSNCSDVLAYRDTQGSTILHSAASTDQVEVIEYLTTTFDMINSTDHQGNTALHVASYSGQLAAVRSLIIAFPSLTSSTNYAGETFLHKAVSGFQTAVFRRLDRQIELMKQLVSRMDFPIGDVVNVKNNDGKTALHEAVIGNSPLELVQLLMTAESIDVNVYDANRMTPLDYLKSRPASASSDILIRQLLSAGGIFNCQDYTATRALASQLKMHGSSSSTPGTLFRISDAEIFLYTGIENTTDASAYQCSAGLSSSSSEINARNSTYENGRRASSLNSAAARLTRAFLWPKGKDKKSRHSKSSNEKSPIEQCRIPNDTGETPSPLRQRFNSKPSSSLPNNKRTLSVRTNQTSPTPKRFASGTVLGVTKSTSHGTVRGRSPSNSLSRSSVSSTNSLDKQKGMC